MILHRPDFSDEPLVYPEPVRPFEGPPVGEFRTVQQRINDLRALRGILVGEERPHLAGGGKSADGVEVRPADEVRVGTEGRRLDPKNLQLREDVFIDVIRHRRLGPAEVRVRVAEQDHRRRHAPHVLGGHYDLAGPRPADRAVVPDAGSEFVVDREPRQTRDVPLRSIGEGGDNLERHRRGGSIEDRLRWRDRDRGWSWGNVAVVGRPLCDPIANKAVEVAVGVEPAATLVRGERCSFLENQTAIRGNAVDSPTAHFSRESLDVEGGVVPPQTEPEAVLPGRRAMTRPRVAPRLREDRDDLPREADPLRGGAGRRETEREHCGGEASEHGNFVGVDDLAATLDCGRPLRRWQPLLFNLRNSLASFVVNNLSLVAAPPRCVSAVNSRRRVTSPCRRPSERSGSRAVRPSPCGRRRSRGSRGWPARDRYPAHRRPDRPSARSSACGFSCRQ